MRKTLVFSLLIMTFAGCLWAEGAARKQTDAEIINEVMRVEAERDKALQTGDAATLNRIYGDDVAFVNARGVQLTKAEHIKEHSSREMKFLSFNQDQTDAHVYDNGNTVVIAGRARSVTVYRGKVNRIPRRFTNVYIKQNGQWKLIFHYETLIQTH
ncbi:MAG: nuclear transport factor 2 family protein [Terriglobia bacterium]